MQRLSLLVAEVGELVHGGAPTRGGPVQRRCWMVQVVRRGGCGWSWRLGSGGPTGIPSELEWKLDTGAFLVGLQLGEGLAAML